MNPPDAPPIRIALLGADEVTLALTQAVVADHRFELVGACELDNAGPSLAHLGRLRRFEHWESLLDPSAVDAVIVARGANEDLRADQLRKLVQAAMPVLVAHPVVASMLVYYELDMIRRDTRSAVVPYLPLRHHPGVSAVAELVAEGASSPVGRVEQVVFDRQLTRPDKPAVLTAFARDVDVVRAVAGDMTRLGAMAAGHKSESYAGLGVQMSGPGAVVARWSVGPADASSAARLTVLGDRGKAELDLRDDAPWRLQVTAAGQTTAREFDPWNPAAAALDQLALAIGGAAPSPDWVDASRAIELTETIDRSLAKGRTIELYYEDYTEQGTFKGTMASVGCGLLMLTLGLLVFVALAEQMGLPFLKYWPHVVVGGLAVFLLAQLLMLVFRRGDDR